MNPETLRSLLADVAAGRVTVEGAYDRVKHLPGEDMGFAHLDHHRAIRQGQAEVVFCQGKTVDQVTAICRRFAERTGSFLGTRADEAQARALENLFPALEWNPTARTVYLRPTSTPPLTGAGTVLVVSA